MKKDFFKILGVSREATLSEIKSAYRKLALKHHPDKSGHAKAHEHFKEINEAYKVLSDPVKRREYVEGEKAAITDDPLAFANKLWNDILKKEVIHEQRG